MHMNIRDFLTGAQQSMARGAGKPVLIEYRTIQPENKKWGGLCRVPEIVVDKLTGRIQ